ncbi:MAG: hypothetical protein IJT89_07425 [Bacteroidaceae bacterium]|jgi:hypothetical protein|uniref:hypothetical protein n=1 Tax=unclassified Bacteroides TaxID=2646097 RepID=UPI0004E2366E|nr:MULTISPECIES: hypothetical protein [unclassified Bacteroides]MBO4598101.1 hypothetical protein [Bacteroidaceae bacterium]MBP5219705.1 hypothetical protein [Bacteroidaceae bacterium]MBQ4460835.1 hypothetical protein [Bacteroidaceae bacterium]MBQ7483864.1 hypothetical protein [Bacteroidaceae bacterium]MBR6367788.1 hypothetical protein [Bacteroidaceae bacterium]
MKRLLLTLFCITLFTAFCEAQNVVFKYRNTAKIIKGTNEEMKANNTLEFLTFTPDYTTCWFSDASGNNNYGDVQFAYQKEEEGRYVFHYENPDNPDSSWDLTITKDYANMRSISSNAANIKVYERLID